jgi:membrane associated rhomboid family serine protease
MECAMGIMTPWVMRLMIANGVMFLLTALRPNLTMFLMWVPAFALSQPWTIVTYMFLHDGVMHLLFNMLGLMFFGPRLEEELGVRDFLLLYFLSGIAGALLSFVTPSAAIVGASGAVYGVFLGFARYWPHEKVLIWGVLPVEARTLVIVMTALSLFGGFSGGGNIAHFAHLGGFVGGFAFLLWRDRATRAARFRTQPTVPAPSSSDLKRWKSINTSRLHEVNREEVERILKKIDESGPETLTPAEKMLLDRFSSL